MTTDKYTITYRGVERARMLEEDNSLRVCRWLGYNHRVILAAAKQISSPSPKIAQLLSGWTEPSYTAANNDDDTKQGLAELERTLAVMECVLEEASRLKFENLPEAITATHTAIANPLIRHN